MSERVIFDGEIVVQGSKHQVVITSAAGIHRATVDGAFEPIREAHWDPLLDEIENSKDPATQIDLVKKFCAEALVRNIVV